MDRERFLDGKLTKERKTWLQGILDSLNQNSSESPSFDEYLLKILINSVLNEDSFLIGRVLPAVDPNKHQDYGSICDVIVFAAAVGSELGDSECSLLLGDAMVLGHLGLNSTLSRGSRYWGRAMDQGNPEGALRFADYYEGYWGHGDYETALSYCIRAALIGDNAEAFYRIGDFYFKGRVVERDTAMAKILYKRSYDLAKEKCHKVDLACAAVRLAEVKRDKSPMQQLSLDVLEEMLAYYAEAEPIFKDRNADSCSYLKPDIERCLKGMSEVEERIDMLKEGSELAD